MFPSLFSLKRKPAGEDPDTLLGRAFAKKPASTLLNNTGEKVPIAIYVDPTAGVRRSLIRILLLFILPVLALLIIGGITFFTLSNNTKPEQLKQESITMTDVPLPAGVQLLTTLPDVSYSNYFKNLSQSWLKGYSAQVVSIQNFRISLTPGKILDYYHLKMVDSKQWQQYRQAGLPAGLDTLYVKALPNNQIEGVILEIQVKQNQNLKTLSIPEEEATGFILAKIIARRTF